MVYPVTMRYRGVENCKTKKTDGRHTRRGKRGFALIATLTLMMLLAMLAVGVLAMASSQSRISMQAVLQAQARQQALVGLDAAIAQLQIELGPDRRVSASSGILRDDENAPGTHLLGAWDSWDGPIYGKSASGHGQIQSTYTQGRSNMFRRWLISARKPDDTRSINTAAQLSSRKPGQRVCLLGQGTLGDTASPSHYIYADMVPLPPLSESDPNTGCFAWWVCGENQKAKVGFKEPEETNDPIEVLHRTWNTPGAKFSEDAGLGLPDKLDRPERVLTMPELPLLGGSSAPAGMPYFFDATVSSHSLLTNVRTGGFKQDLCLLLDKESLTGTEFACRSSQDCPIVEGNDVPKGTEPSMPIGSWQTMYAYYNSWPDGTATDGAFAARLQGGLTGDLYTRMCGSGTDISGSSIKSPDTGGQMSFYDSRSMMDSGNPVAGYARTPVMLAFVSNYALYSELKDATDPDNTSYHLCIAYAPMVLWWNPYNVPMRIPGHKLWSFSAPYRQIWLRKFNDIPEKDSDTYGWQDMINQTATGDLDLFSFGRDSGDFFERAGGGRGEIVFQPGEILFFAPSKGRSREEKQAVRTNPWQMGYTPNAINGYNMRLYSNVTSDETSKRFIANFSTEIAIGGGQYEPGKIDRMGLPADPHGWSLVPGRSDCFTVVAGFGGMEETETPDPSDNAALNDKGGMSPQRMLLGWLDPDSGIAEDKLAPGEQTLKKHTSISERFHWGSEMNDDTMPFFFCSLGVAAKSANLKIDNKVYPGKDYRTKIWQHSSPAFWGSAILDPDDQTRRYHPYQLATLNVGSGLTAAPIDNIGNNGILGITSDGGEQVSYASVMEIPVHPPFSLAGFAGMRLQPGWYKTSGGDRGGISQLRRMQYQAGVPGVGIGNAFADPCLPPGDVYSYFEQRELGMSVTGNTHIFGDFFDHGLLINDALWDRWFCSSISDMPGRGGKVRAEDSLRKFMRGTEPLPVARYKKTNSPYRDEQVVEQIMDNDGWMKIAQYLMIDGGFNVNSTSVEAWNAVLQGLAKRKLVALKDGRLTLVEQGKGEDEVLFSRFMASTSDKSLDSLGGYSVMQGSAQLRSSGGSMASAWGEVRMLQPETIRLLAEEMVKQVRKRGPFLNMSDFINRRLEAEGGENALKGALQAAIDATDVNQEFFNEVILNTPGGGRLFKFPQADEGSMHTAAPGYLIQSDVLASLGNILTVRDDTFTVRAYGCVRTKEGSVLAQAWCEATVQRSIEYVSPVNAPEAAEFKPDGTRGQESLNEVNRQLGRKMRVVAFKWMDPWDI